MEAVKDVGVLWMTYRRQVVFEARKFGFPEDSLEDITSDFFAHIITKKYLDMYDPSIAAFSTFMGVALRRFLISKKKRTRRAAQFNIQDTHETADGDTYSPIEKFAQAPEEITGMLTGWWETRPRLLQNLKSLPPFCIKIVGSRAILISPLLLVSLGLLGYSLKDIARLVDVSVYAVNHWCKELHQFRDEVDEDAFKTLAGVGGERNGPSDF